MSLRKKLYIAFFVMIMLAVWVGVMSIRAFWRTDRLAESAHQQVTGLGEILIPANRLIAQAYTDVNQASLLLRAYSFNRLAVDYDGGMNNLQQIRDRIGQFDEILKSPAAAALAGSRDGVRQSRAALDSISSQAGDLHSSMMRVDALQEQINVSLEETNEFLNGLYDIVIEEISAQFADQEATGMTPLRDRMLKTWKSLDDIYNAVASSEVLFWQGRGKYGEEAAAVFLDVEAQVMEQAKQLRSFIDSGLVVDADVLARYNGLSECLTKYVGLVNEFADEWKRSADLNAMVTESSRNLLDVFDRLDNLTADLALKNAESARDSTATVTEIVNTSEKGALISLVVALIVGVLLAVFITQSIIRPINAVIASLSVSEEVIGDAASKISSASNDLSEGVTQQAASLHETTSSLDQMASMARSSAANAKTTNDNALKTSSLVRDGATDMKEMSEAMSKINGQADRISNIIKTIEEIAFQTNLLALNAAVEAARAGEAGKGFAVVADEVRSLSGRSAQAAKDTAELITATVESVRSGSVILDRLSGSYGEVEGSIGGIQGLIGKIVGASEEQSHDVEQINSAISQVNRITQQNASGAAESAASVQNLEGQISDLQEDIAVLRGIISGKKAFREPAAGAKKVNRPTIPPSRQLATAVMTPDDIE